MSSALVTYALLFSVIISLVLYFLYLFIKFIRWKNNEKTTEQNNLLRYEKQYTFLMEKGNESRFVSIAGDDAEEAEYKAKKEYPEWNLTFLRQ